MIIIIIKVKVFDDHRVETSRRHIGVTTEDNANIFEFTLPEVINEYDISTLKKELIFTNSEGSFVYTLNNSQFAIPSVLTTCEFFDMELKLSARNIKWLTFPVRYELKESLDDSGENTASLQKQEDLEIVRDALTESTGIDYSESSWDEVLEAIKEIPQSLYSDFKQAMLDKYLEFKDITPEEAISSGDKIYEKLTDSDTKIQSIEDIEELILYVYEKLGSKITNHISADSASIKFIITEDNESPINVEYSIVNGKPCFLIGDEGDDND